eukprot:299991-Chlamydomonas_euryale.AAC.1
MALHTKSAHHMPQVSAHARRKAAVGAVVPHQHPERHGRCSGCERGVVPRLHTHRHALREKHGATAGQDATREEG